jgi:hypothetical protein
MRVLGPGCLDWVFGSATYELWDLGHFCHIALGCHFFNHIKYLFLLPGVILKSVDKRV